MTMLENYKRDGFVVVKRAFQPSWKSAAMEDRCRSWQQMPREEYLRAARIFPRGAYHTAIFLNDGIARPVMQLGIKDPVFLTSPAVHVMGVDETWEGVGAHQDWPALQSSLNTVVVWLPLTDVGPENYPVEFVKGSHLKGLLPAKPGAHYSEVDTEGMEFTPAPCQIGDVILFNVFTVHRTRTPGKGFRIAFSMRYEDSADPWFKEHGNYSAQKRVIEREVKWVPSVEQVKAVFA